MSTKAFKHKTEDRNEKKRERERFLTLITCVKDTAIFEKDTQAETCAIVWKRATGARLMISFFDTFGTG